MNDIFEEKSCNKKCRWFGEKLYELDVCKTCVRNQKLTDNFKDEIVEGWVCIFKDNSISSMSDTKEEAKKKRLSSKNVIVFLRQIEDMES